MWFIFVIHWTDPHPRYTAKIQKVYGTQCLSIQMIHRWMWAFWDMGRTDVHPSSQNARIYRWTIWMDIHFLYFVVYTRWRWVQCRTKMNHTTHFSIDIRGNWRLLFTGTWFVEFVSSCHEIFTVLPESEKLIVPPVSSYAVTLHRFYRVGKFTFGTALVLKNTVWVYLLYFIYLFCNFGWVLHGHLLGRSPSSPSKSSNSLILC